jgi:hypothetical protein
MIVPGFEPKKMSDEEIVRKVTDLQGKLVFAYGMGSYSIVEQLNAMLEALQHEQMERMLIRLHEMRERMAPAVIETEPDLREKKEVEVKSKKAGMNSGKFASFFPPKTKKPAEIPGDQMTPNTKHKPDV